MVVVVAAATKSMQIAMVVRCCNGGGGRRLRGRGELLGIVMVVGRYNGRAFGVLRWV